MKNVKEIKVEVHMPESKADFDKIYVSAVLEALAIICEAKKAC